MSCAAACRCLSAGTLHPLIQLRILLLLSLKFRSPPPPRQAFPCSPLVPLHLVSKLLFPVPLHLVPKLLFLPPRCR